MSENRRRAGRAPRTLLERLIWQREATYEEQAEAFARLARQLGEPATLSVRHLQRLASGQRSGEHATPSMRRVLRQLYGHRIEELLAAPQTPALPAADPARDTHAQGGAPAQLVDVAGADASRWASASGLPRLPDALGMALVTYLGSVAQPGRDSFNTPRERDRAYDQLVQFLQSWAHTVDRRDVLRVLGWAATAASLPALDADERQRVTSVLDTPGRVDAQTIEHIEAVLRHCRRQDHALGPQAVLDTVLAQRDLSRALVPECPPALRPRMLSALSEASRQAGWLSFDLNQFDHAGYYYEDARALAHEAQNVGLGAFVLCEMSHLATWQGTPRIGVDHAVAAGQWAQRTDDLRLRAYTADVTARAYAADGQREACLAALDTAHTALAAADQTPSLSTYDEAIHVSIRGGCHLALGEADRAVSYAQQSLESLDRSFVRDVAMTLVDLGTAYIQCKEVDEAARLLGDAADIAARNSSARLVERLKRSRAELQPWAHTAPVRQLDERLASSAIA